MTRSLPGLSRQVGAALAARGLMLATAESCTGGWVAQVITATPGSSQWFERGFITYSNAAKEELLGVSAATLKQHGAVSEATAREMARGALERSHAQVALAITGIAGPGGGSAEKPVGTVCISWAWPDGSLESRSHQFPGNRFAVRRQAVVMALGTLLSRLGGVLGGRHDSRNPLTGNTH